MKAPVVHLGTSILYGVFFTEKSYLIGLQRLLKGEHAKMLVTKIAGDRLPQELIDMIVSRLHESLMKSVESVWNGVDRWEAFNEKFPPRTFSRRTPDENAVEDMLVSEIMNYATPNAEEVKFPFDGQCQVIWPVEVSNPDVRNTNVNAIRDPGNPSRYVHIAATWERPLLRLDMASGIETCRNNNQKAKYLQPRADIIANCTDNIGDECSRDFVYYMPIPDEHDEMPAKKDVSTHRIIRCSSIEESVKNWNEAAQKTYIDLLELEVVPIDPQDPLKPHLHIWQEFTHIARRSAYE